MSAKAGTLSRLIRSARVEFAQKGLAGARVEMIARHAGVTKQLVYHYYHSKEALFAAVLTDACATMPRVADTELAHLSPPDALRRFLHAIFEQYRADPMLGPLAREGIRFHEDQPDGNKAYADLLPALRDSFGGILARGIGTGDFRHDLDPDTLLALAVLTMSGGFTNRHSLSVILGADTGAEGMERWRIAAAEFVMAAVRV